MGSRNSMRSAHQADIKGKGILYEDDDEPIKLVDRDDSFVIKEFGLSLIGKILNPKKQNVVKLLQTMPSQWGLSERITANDLGNGKFLFNFMSEEDLNSVLRQGPFHYNFCMFVLVRWEPIVHDDYPWVIPFWVQLIGFPLHLWTDANLRNIGGRLGHVDTLELTEGRMLIDIDSRRPLKFSRKVEYEGDEVTIEIKYDKLFKHCTTCGFLSHEKGYCTAFDVRSRLQHPERTDVFSRVQLAHDSSRQLLSRGAHPRTEPPYQPSLQSREPQLSRYRSSKPSRYDERDEEENRWGRHADRIVRSRDNYPRRSRYGGARAGPYVRPNERSWQVKQSQHVVVGKGQTDVGTGATSRSATSREIVPYEHLPDPVSRTEQISETLRSGDKPTSRKIASAIVTPSRMDHHMEENVTLRDRGEARALSFSSPGGTEPSNGDDAIIGALSDMENLDQPDGGMLEDGVDDDDLLALDLMDLDGHQSQHASLVDKRQMDNTNATKSKKHGVKRNAPLGINHRKFEILRRGSPAKRSASTSSHAKGAGEKPIRRHGSNRDKDSVSTRDGLMSSKNSSRRHP